MIDVHSCNVWKVVTTKELLPGDIISLSYKKRNSNKKAAPTAAAAAPGVRTATSALAGAGANSAVTPAGAAGMSQYVLSLCIVRLFLLFFCYLTMFAGGSVDSSLGVKQPLFFKFFVEYSVYRTFLVSFIFVLSLFFIIFPSLVQPQLRTPLTRARAAIAPPRTPPGTSWCPATVFSSAAKQWSTRPPLLVSSCLKRSLCYFSFHGCCTWVLVALLNVRHFVKLQRFWLLVLP